MSKWEKRGLLCALMLLVCLTFTGCSLKFATSPEDLYCLPQLPPEYTELNNCIQALLKDGAEYAAPTSGTNIQPVQLVDLDGDGREEALAFLRNTNDEKPLKIYIFSPRGQSYVQTAVIEGNGTAISSIAYKDLDQDGKLELVIGWKVGSELQALTVYSLREQKPQELMRTDYVKYAVADLSRNKTQQIVVLRSDDEGDGVADYYSWGKNRTSLTLSSTARLSVTMAELNSGQVTIGALSDGTPALFVTGVSDSSTEMTDILAVKQGGLVNVTLSDTTGVTTEVYRYLSLFPTDINNDGITEVPVAVSVPTRSGGTREVYYRIDWHSYGNDGKGTTVEFTYHDTEDGWYLVMPSAWKGKILITRTQTSSDEACVTLSHRESPNAEPQDFLCIYTMSGDNREVKAVRGNRFILSRQAETVYAAELLDGNAGWEYGMTEDRLRASFHLITTEWMGSDG